MPFSLYLQYPQDPDWLSIIYVVAVWIAAIASLFYARVRERHGGGAMNFYDNVGVGLCISGVVLALYLFFPR